MSYDIHGSVEWVQEIMDANFDMKPIREKCRIEPIPGIKLFARCHEPNTASCTHALVLEYRVLCRHPQWQQMMIIDGD
jgi:hypothetical protein